jgi:hypothetical protein
VPADLLHVLAVVVPEQQVVAVAGRVERRGHHQRHEPVLDQVELLDDLRSQQAQGVGERREREARHQLLGDRRAADEVALLEDERAQPGLRQVAGVDEPVVPCADDDRVVGRCAVRHGRAVFLAGLNKGSFAVCARTLVLWWFTASSRCTSDPGAASSGRTRASPTCRCSTGEYMKLVV